MRAASRFALSVALLVPVSVTGSALAAATAHAAAAPTVVITSPVAGATVTDLLPVGVTSTTDPAGADYPLSTSLYVDGSLVSGPQFCNSPIGAKTCTQNHLWTSDAKNGTFTLQVVMTTELGATVSSPPVTVTAKNPPPTVSITSPSEGALAGSDVTVDAVGVLDPSEPFDFGGNLFLDVDGNQVSSYLCGFNPASNGCSGSLHWNTLGAATGSHTLTVRFTTVYGGKATSAPVHVMVSADPLTPSITLLDPPDGTIFGGYMGFLASGNVAAGQVPSYMILVVDHQFVGPAGSCNPPPGNTPPLGTACALDMVLDASGMSGQHTVQVALFDTNGHEGITAPITVTVRNPVVIPTTVTLSPGGTVQRGSPGVVHGTVVNNATGAPFASAVRVTVVMSPTNAPSETITVFTGPGGAFTATASLPLPANTGVVASVSPAYGSASASTSIAVTVPITCHVPAVAHRNASVAITCTAPDLAYDSVLALHFASKIPHATEYGRVRHGKVTFTTTFAYARQLKVWATTATTKTFTASRSATSLLTIV